MNFNILQFGFQNNCITKQDVYDAVVKGQIDINQYKLITGEQEIELPLETLKQIKVKEFNDKCNSEILAGYTSSVKHGEQHYDFDYETQINMLGLFTAVTVGGATEIEWKNSDQLICEIWGANEFLQLYNEAMAYKTDKIKRCHTLRVLIDSCTTLEELSVITWDMELPE